MSDTNPDRLPKDVHDLLLHREEEEARPVADGPVLDARRPKREKFFTIPVIVVMVTVALTALGLLVIYSSAGLREQFEAMLRGELGAYKEQMRKAKVEKVREIESVTGNRYGSLTLFYSPRDAKVTIVQRKYALDCTKAQGEDALLQCLKGKVDYSQTPVETQVDNPSLHLDRSKREVVEQIPLIDIPIQEGSDDRRTMYRYEMLITIEADGYHPRRFFLTADRERQMGEGWETLYWEQKGPNVWMVNVQGADLLPKPETARANYQKALQDWECIRREIEAKRKAGKKVSEDTESGLFIEILNRNGFKTFEEFNVIDQELRKDEKFAREFDAELRKMTCN